MKRSTYGKARLRERIRTVRSGKPAPEAATLDERLTELESRGVVVPSSQPAELRPLAKRKGALRRFLKDRN